MQFYSVDELKCSAIHVLDGGQTPAFYQNIDKYNADAKILYTDNTILRTYTLCVKTLSILGNQPAKVLYVVYLINLSNWLYYTAIKTLP